MTVEQAVLLYRYDTSGTKIGVDADTAEAAKKWVAKKEEQWDMASMTIYHHLRVAETVDPVLVHSTREKSGGDRLVAPTQAILKHFSNEIPNDFSLQNLVMGIAIERNLKGPEVAGLCRAVKDMTLVQARKFIDDIDWETWQPVYSETKARAIRRAHDPRHKGAGVYKKARAEVDGVAQRIRLLYERREPVIQFMKDNVVEALNATHELIHDLGAIATELESLVESDFDTTKLPTSGEVEPALPTAKPNSQTPSKLTATNRRQSTPQRQAARQTPKVSLSAVDPVIERTQKVRSKDVQTAKPRTLEIRTVAGESSFTNQLQDFLNGRIDLPPEITSRHQAHVAEQLLINGSFSGDTERQEDVRLEIAEFRRKKAGS